MWFGPGFGDTAGPSAPPPPASPGPSPFERTVNLAGQIFSLYQQNREVNRNRREADDRQREQNKKLRLQQTAAQGKPTDINVSTGSPNIPPEILIAGGLGVLVLILVRKR